MKQITQNTAIEAWFADAGLEVIQVAACPKADCPRCRPALAKAA